MNHRGYFVSCVNETFGIAVVASSARIAKKIGYAYLNSNCYDCDWVDVRVRWMRVTKVSDLPVGVVEDDMLALRRGLYSWVDDGVCDLCKNSAMLEMFKGKAVCPDCLEKI